LFYDVYFDSAKLETYNCIFITCTGHRIT